MSPESLRPRAIRSYSRQQRDSRTLFTNVTWPRDTVKETGMESGGCELLLVFDHCHLPHLTMNHVVIMFAVIVSRPRTRLQAFITYTSMP
jgi:hypothetical protein